MKLHEIKNLEPVDTIEEASDLSELKPDVIQELQKRIKEGAKDTEQKWANALELVHKAYQVVGVERPVPAMTSAWTQYEEIITFAVKELSKFRGFDADWRSTSVEYPKIDTCGC